MMKNIIANIAKLLGWVTWYHVSYQFSNSKGMVVGDMIVSIRPWLRQGDSFNELRDYLHKENSKNGCTTIPNIISITRIGS